MHQASFYEVLKVVLIILLIYFGFKLLIRWFGPMLLRYFLKRIGKKFGQKFGGFDPFQQEQKKEEGEVSVEKKPKSSRRSKKDVGEYIDYEEID